MASLTQAELEARINSIMCELFELEPQQLHPDAELFSELELDSLDAIDLVIHFQREFKVKLENKELQEIRRLSDIYALVSKHYDRHSGS